MKIYWFFPALKPKVMNPPLIIWLQGGPGVISMIGLFYETGPIQVTEDHKLTRNNNTWANDHSMLFIEQPVGTGYSLVNQGGDKKGSKHKEMARRSGSSGGNDDDTDGDDVLGFDNEEDDDGEKDGFETLVSELERDQEEEAAFFATLTASESFEFKVAAASKRYVKDQRAVAKDMMVFLDQFYGRYPEQQKADLYIAGQSYVGKFIPSIAHAIMDRNRKVKAKLSQSGGGVTEAEVEVSMATTLTCAEAVDTEIQIHTDHAYYLGLLTEPQADQMREYQRLAVELVEQGRFLDANRFRGKIFNLFRNSTGGHNTFDIRKGSHGINWKLMATLLNQPEIKDSLNMFGPHKSYLVQQGAPQQEVDRI
ncbi:hypothetical protein BGW39_007920 [Mortierella sp. 14UC]|nr:hypothetical protein BGW39_007920 [Mortierella sp. 14UC]